MYDKRKEEEKKQLWVISKCLNTLFARSSNVVANYKIFVFFFLSILSQSSFPGSLNIIKKGHGGVSNCWSFGCKAGERSNIYAV